MRIILLCFCLLIVAAACRNGKKVAGGDVDSSLLFADYRISGEEEKEDVAIVLRFRSVNEEGEPQFLQEPARIELDGVALQPDSARRGGAFYEVVKPAAGFAGSHRLRYVDASGEAHEEGFVYRPFSLAQPVPERLRQQPFRLQLAGLDQERLTVQLVMTDTSFASPDVNEDVVVEKSVLNITARHLAALAEGPIFLEIYRDEERPVQPAGRLVLSYGLRRQFELVR